MCGIDWVNVGKMGVYYIQNGIKWWKNGMESRTGEDRSTFCMVRTK